MDPKEIRNSGDFGFFRCLVESSADVITAHTLAGDLLYVSPSCRDLVGYSPEYFRETDFRTLIHPEDMEVVRGLFRAIPASATPVTVPFRVKHAKGYMVWLEAIGKLMPTQAPGLEPMILINVRNATARRLVKQQRDKMSALLDVLTRQLEERMELLRITEKQLVQSQKLEAIGQLAGGIAHDFNNLLGGVVGFSEAIEHEAASSNPGIAEKAARIHQAAGRGMDLTRKILSFARINSGRREIESLNEIISEAKELLKRTLPKIIAIELELDPGLWPVHCDRSEMIQVLLNLGINAKDAMEKGGKIKIRTSNQDSPEGRFVRLDCIDSGVGISPEIQDRIFEPFFTTKDVGKGTGLGLSVVYGIIQSHRGTIRVSSEPGSGACFSIQLPAEAGAAASIRHNASLKYSVPVSRHTSSFSGRTVLVIDDDDDLRELSEDILAASGFNLLSAADGSEALSLFQEHASSIDLIVLDINLPEKSGREVFSEIRSRQPMMPIIAFSGLSKEDLPQPFQKDIHVTFLEKPCTQDEYLQAVRKAVEASASRA
jgi:two-component system cell cycle sensor histidine kinase/response regulator CckA